MPVIMQHMVEAELNYVDANANAPCKSEGESSCCSPSLRSSGSNGNHHFYPQDAVARCPVHGIPCKFICHDCACTLCSECIIESHQHHCFERAKTHQNLKQEIKSLKNDAVEFYKTLKSLHGRAAYQKKCIMECVDQTKDDLAVLREQLISLVNTFCDSLVADMQDEYSHTLCAITNLLTTPSRLKESLKGIRDQVRQFCAESSDVSYEELHHKLQCLTDDMHNTLSEYSSREWPDRIVVRVDDQNLNSLYQCLQELKTVYFANQSRFVLSSDFEYHRADDEEMLSDCPALNSARPYWDPEAVSNCSVLNTVPPYWDPDIDFPLTGPQIEDTEILTWDNRLCFRNACTQCNSSSSFDSLKQFDQIDEIRNQVAPYVPDQLPFYPESVY